VIEAQVVQTTSRALYEEVKSDGSNVTSADWLTHPTLDMKDAPESIDIVLVDHPELAPAGAGEAVCRPLAGAPANSIFDATCVGSGAGTPERLKRGIAQQPVKRRRGSPKRRVP
jgi:nicotinate dehydrogenase subunit B